EHHDIFQMRYYAHHTGGNPDARDKYRDHRWFHACAHFCEHWDQASFDPDYPTPPLAHFEPLVRRMLSRRPHDPAVTQAG
ncbi:MAG: hypothetical protein U5K76_03220, partial [Woeseiaceae bacterium]|nr:hypothetical protein [Woeseiaceae bacterium]